MSNYSSDRSFTDYVHHNLAIPLIYKSLNWDVVDVDAEMLTEIDMNEGIDYILKNIAGETILVQERFRDFYYAKYNDATLRFRRELNPNPDRIRSEFYKIKANYLVYGITNGSKFIDKRHSLTDFVKWVVLDLDFIRKQLESGTIRIVTDSRINCWEENGVLYCPENFNPDGSSSFIPFDVILLKKIWGNDPIKARSGYL